MAREFEKQGLTIKEYTDIHLWLAKNFIKPKCCTGCGCKNKVLDAALITGKRYEKNIESYIALCRKCHKEYDKEQLNRNKEPRKKRVPISSPAPQIRPAITCVPTKISIEDFATKYNMNKRKVYNMIARHKHLKIKVKGLGTLIDETKYLKLVG